MSDVISITDLNNQSWYTSLPDPQKKLLGLSVQLLDEFRDRNNQYYDYSFILVAAAKAYEGFVKDLVYSLGLITKKRYQGKRFRVGKALNPEIARAHPEGFEILYDDLKKICGDEGLADQLWQTWKLCRNQVFHYFVIKPHLITYQNAQLRLLQIITTMKDSTTACKKLTTAKQ